jgi:hypothetical protein
LEIVSALSYTWWSISFFGEMEMSDPSSKTSVNVTAAGPENKIKEFTYDEIISLKELANTRDKIWWKNYLLIVPILAFLLSLATSIISIVTSHRKDIHDQQTELASAIRTTHELNIKAVEIQEKYKVGTLEYARQSSLIGNQLNSTVIMAADIAIRLGTNTPSSILIPISQGLYNYGDYARAEEVVKLALNAARGPEDETGALRWLGFMKIRSGSAKSLDEGNQIFFRAANIEQKHGLEQFPERIPWLKAFAQLEWARASVTVDCNEARKHFLEAVTILNSAGRDYVLTNQLRGTAQRVAAGGIGGVRTCMPAPDTPSVE